MRGTHQAPVAMRFKATVGLMPDSHRLDVINLSSSAKLLDRRFFMASGTS